MTDPALVAVICRLRLERGVTQEALAFDAGVTIATLSRVERGITGPAWTTIRAIAQALEVSMAELGAAVEAEEQH